MSSRLGQMIRESAQHDVGPLLQGDGAGAAVRRAVLKGLMHGGAGASDAAAAAAPIADAALSAVGSAGDAFLDPSKRMPGQVEYNMIIDAATGPNMLAAATIPAAVFMYDTTNTDRSQHFMRQAAQAQNIGENTMTRNLRSFSKQAGMFSAGAGRVVGGGAEPISDLLKKLIMKDGEVSLVRSGALGAGLLGAAGAADLMAPTADVWGYKLQKHLTDADDRTQLQDEALKGFVQSSSKGMGTLLTDIVGNAIGSAGQAAGNAALTFTQSAVFSRVMANDPMLSQASGADKELLIKAYGSMTRFAPDVATDEFAVKNYLREALMSSNGPDYSTLGNLARVNQSLTGDR